MTGYGYDPLRGMQNDMIQRDIERMARMKPLAQVLHEDSAARDAAHSAGAIFRSVITQVAEFERSLDDTQEVALHLVNFGHEVRIRVRLLGYIDPAIIFFVGNNLVDDQEVRLIQHVTQMSFLMARATRLHPEQPKAPIGFVTE
jgi:hypothetical protein